MRPPSISNQTQPARCASAQQSTQFSIFSSPGGNNNNNNSNTRCLLSATSVWPSPSAPVNLSSRRPAGPDRAEQSRAEAAHPQSSSGSELGNRWPHASGRNKWSVPVTTARNGTRTDEQRTHRTPVGGLQTSRSRSLERLISSPIRAGKKEAPRRQQSPLAVPLQQPTTTNRPPDTCCSSPPSAARGKQVARTTVRYANGSRPESQVHPDALSGLKRGDQ